MAYNADHRIKRAFDSLGPKNPLMKLDTAERQYLWALLVIYVQGSRKGTESLDPLEGLAETAALARTLAKRIQSQMFEGKDVDSLRPFIGQFYEVPQNLMALGNRLGLLLDQTAGKRGHMGKVLMSRFLVTASEFVRMKTRGYNDEHLAELIQALTSSGLQTDFSGDAIRKKRNHLKKTYPVVYSAALREVRKCL